MIVKLINKYIETTDLNRFLIKGGFLFMVWRVFRKWMILKGQNTSFTDTVADLYLHIAEFFLQITGFETLKNTMTNQLWLKNSQESIEIVYDCLGVNLFFIFVIFILAYPSTIKRKIFFVPLGCVAIFLLNAARMAALTVIVSTIPEKMDLYHHFIFQGVIFIFIFFLWYLFTLRFIKKDNWFYKKKKGD